MSDEFYIGYEPRMPPALAARSRRTAAALLALCAGIPALLLIGQDASEAGVFEYGRVRTFTGRLIEKPYPLLETRDGRVYLLVAPYKFGAAALVRGHDQDAVRLDGTLIYREGHHMIEVRPGSVRRIVPRPPRPRAEVRESVRFATVSGEIVDPKCYLGVMKPGRGPLHRDCAVRCLSGGIPPMLVADDAGDGPRRMLLLTAAGTRPSRAMQRIVGKRVSLTGTLTHVGDVWFLASPDLE